MIGVWIDRIFDVMVWVSMAVMFATLIHGTSLCSALVASPLLVFSIRKLLNDIYKMKGRSNE